MKYFIYGFLSATGIGMLLAMLQGWMGNIAEEECKNCNDLKK